MSEFEAACSKYFKVKISLKLEKGVFKNSPESLKAQENNIKQSSAESSIDEDVGIQNIMKKFNHRSTIIQNQEQTSVLITIKF